MLDLYKGFESSISGRSGWPWTEGSISIPDLMPDGSPWPKISIVTPSYNQTQFIEETIRSVLLQGYPNLEYIIIDGGSTDGSLEIIKKYAPRLSYWVSEKDNGQSHAINKGWKRSNGEILSWLNSDDVLAPGALDEVARIWVEDRRYGFISGITERVDGDGKLLGKYFGSEFNLIGTLSTSKNCVAQQSTFISRAALEQVGYLDVDLHLSMDWDLWVRIAARFPVKFVPRVWSRIRIWDDTKTSTLLHLSGREHVRIVQKLFKECIDGLPVDLHRKALAAAYGREAVLYHQQADYMRFRWAVILSLLYALALKGGDARKLLPEAFPGLSAIQVLLSFVKSIGKKLRNRV